MSVTPYDLSAGADQQQAAGICKQVPQGQTSATSVSALAPANVAATTVTGDAGRQILRQPLLEDRGSASCRPGFQTVNLLYSRRD
jgi:hypothetical protein